MKSTPYVEAYRKRNPWARPREYARRRCTDPKHKDWKFYGGRGIKFFLTMDDVRDLWARDHAYAMQIPTIDRINPDGDYCYSNCRFMERDENVDRRRKHSKPIQHDECVASANVQWEE